MKERPSMRIAVVLFFLTVVGALTPIATRFAHADECDTLTCQELCRADRHSCMALRLTLREWLRSFCKSDASDAQFECIDAKTQADEDDCALLCGSEFKTCKKTNDDAYDACLNSMQAGIQACKDEIRFELKDARAGCLDDYDACRADCAAPN